MILTHMLWVVVLLAAALQVQARASIVDDKLLSVDGDGANWPAYGRNFSEQRYSPLDQINTDTVKRLGID